MSLRLYVSWRGRVSRLRRSRSSRSLPRVHTMRPRFVLDPRLTGCSNVHSAVVECESTLSFSFLAVWRSASSHHLRDDKKRKLQLQRALPTLDTLNSNKQQKMRNLYACYLLIAAQFYPFSSINLRTANTWKLWSRFWRAMRSSGVALRRWKRKTLRLVKLNIVTSYYLTSAGWNDCRSHRRSRSQGVRRAHESKIEGVRAFTRGWWYMKRQLNRSCSLANRSGH